MKKYVPVFLICLFVVCGILLLSGTASAATSGNYTYTVSNGKATITDCKDSVSGSLKIPSRLGGYPVTAIGDFAFSNCKKITSVQIGNGVETIGYGAFDGCKKLASVKIGKKVRTIYFNQYITTCDPMPTFGACPALKSITVNSKNPYFSSKDGVLFNKKKTTLYIYPQSKKRSSYTIPNTVTSIQDFAFENCKYLTTVKFSKKLKEIGCRAFYGCLRLKSAVIPNSVTIVGDESFSNCKKLTTVKIGKKVKEMHLAYFVFYSQTKGCRNFDHCPALKSITVDKKNPYFSSVGNVIYNKKRNILYRCAPGYQGGVSIPNTVTKIAENAFSGCALKSVKFGKKVKTIEGRAFYECKNLTSVNLPASVKTIGTDTFFGCSKLRTITIGKGVAKIEDSFINCKKLKAINVHKSNTKYSSVDGVLFSKKRTVLIRCPEAKTGKYIVPSKIKTIREYAFVGCNRLTSIKRKGKEIKNQVVFHIPV